MCVNITVSRMKTNKQDIVSIIKIKIIFKVKDNFYDALNINKNIISFTVMNVLSCVIIVTYYLTN